MRTALSLLAQAVPAARRGPRSPLLHFMLGFGIFGLFFISAVDASFIPLPIPGITDILLIVFSAQRANWPLLLAVTSVGSILGGWFSYEVGLRGGMPFLEKRVPARILKPVCNWIGHNAILAVALPALLPPPMPLSPFVLAAGALHMSRRRFLFAFSISRAARHAIAIWLGIRYGRHIIRVWNSFSAKWSTAFLIVLWTTISLGVIFAIWRLWKTSRTVGIKPKPITDPQTPRASA